MKTVAKKCDGVCGGHMKQFAVGLLIDKTFFQSVD